MNMSDRPRTASTRHNAPSIGSDHDGRSALREDLEAVWAISASDGPGAGVDAVLSFAGAVLQRAAMEDDANSAVAEAAATALLVSEIIGGNDAAARRTLFRHAARRLA